MTSAKSNAKIELLMNSPGNKLKLPVVIAEQFEILYLDVEQKHDFKIFANYDDKSKFGQFPASINTSKEISAYKCNVAISTEALLALNNIKYIMKLSDLKLFAKHKADRFEINLNIPDHVCTTLIRSNLQTSTSSIQPKVFDPLDDIFGTKLKINTPSTAYSDDDCTN